MERGTDMPGGGAHFVLSVPGIEFDDYMRMQAAMLQTDPRGPARTWRGRLLGAAGGALAAGAGALFVLRHDLRTEFWMESGRDGWAWSMNGLELLMLLLGLVMLLLLVWGGVAASRYGRLLRRLHADGGGLHGGHELLLNDAGLLWRNASRITYVPWGEMTGAVRQHGMLFLFASRVSAFWLPEATIAAHPGRAGLLALIGRHVRLPEGTGTPPG